MILRAIAAAFVVTYTALVSTALGVLAVTLIAHLSTATWFRAFRTRAELVLAWLPALAVVGLLLLAALPVLYPWVGSNSPSHAYLNVTFFVARYVAYWVVWIGIAESVLAARRAEQRGQVAAANRRFRRTACVGLILLALTMTFAAFDWMMSLTPRWLSSIYGVYWFAGGVLSALALLAVLSAGGRDERSRFGPAPGVADMHSLGKLMTTFVLFWLYTGFAQYIVMWDGDLPREVTWYVSRTHGGWAFVAAVLVFGNFVFPFLLLVMEAIKRSRFALAAIGAVLLALHWLDAFWVILPGLIPVHWWTVLVAAAVLALVCALTFAAAILVRRVTSERSMPAIRIVESPR